MTYEQSLAFILLSLMMAAFLWEKFRYDVVACVALVAAVTLGLVPVNKAFSGFSDDLVIIVGSALIVSAGVARSGVVDLAIKRFFPALSSLRGQMLLLLVSVTVLSAFIKNIGALAIMMPVAFQFARRSGVTASVFLMPMSFGALLGGLMTQIGTSPNIAVSKLRQEITGQPFTMFDFTPVGATLAVAGIVFLIFFYWLVPRRENQNPSLQEALEASAFATEVVVTRQSSSADKTLHDLLQLGGGDVTATAVLRGDTRLSPFADILLREDDVILLNGPSEALDRIVSQGNLAFSGDTTVGRKKRGDISSVEAVIGRGSPLIGQTAKELSLVHTFGVNLLAVSRQGKRINERLGELTLRSGDVVLLQGLRQQMPSILTELGCLPLAEREILLGTDRNILIPLVILAIAMGATAVGLAPVAIAFFAAALAMVAFGVVPVSEVYRAVDGPILVMLAALIPVADTLRTTGGSDLIAGWLNMIAGDLPAWGAVGLILITAMAVTPFLNNAATVLVMAPIAASFASGLGYNPEAFLMAVAIGAGCDFLTPIGHQCNTLVMGPGGYRFSDYARLGFPLSVLIVLVAVPALLIVWPLN
ncbi:SLC13 family permease [Ciceribacter sp. L1K23]|uniref:SLC13 family permease n=1 Tax=unclassified Ciceribacter TaxID=2628820 RepID=UPI001ABEB274|nr:MULTISPECIES: SLC13 family permease [unclassified Ciceribacter]MBO3762077.1 SLC13 family permease [Ciceribacter sp. L1K22]MBR0558075.1 SLC13 family permease [Ciceribacter sp. L1K23]